MKKKEKMKLIPKNTIYCYSASGFDIKTGQFIGYEECPFFCLRKTNLGFRRKGKKEYMQYCKLLHKYLDIQDQCKDCGISYDW